MMEGRIEARMSVAIAPAAYLSHGAAMHAMPTELAAACRAHFGYQAFVG